jgi:hypothetical protein
LQKEKGYMLSLDAILFIVDLSYKMEELKENGRWRRRVVEGEEGKVEEEEEQKE